MAGAGAHGHQSRNDRGPVTTSQKAGFLCKRLGSLPAKPHDQRSTLTSYGFLYVKTCIRGVKLSRGDVKSTGESDPLDLFHSGIRTQTTDATYTTILRIVLCAICEDVLSGTFEERARELVGARAQGSHVGARPHARHLGPAAQEDGAAADGRQLPGPVVDCQLLCPAEEAAGT